MSTRSDMIHQVASLVENTAKELNLVGTDFNLVTVIGRGKACWGGGRARRPFISISLDDRYHDVQKYAETFCNETNLSPVWRRAAIKYNGSGIAYNLEYSSIDADPEIGGMHTNNSILFLTGVICHEVSHAIWFHNKDDADDKNKPHGPVWREYYRKLRNVLVNPFLDTGEDVIFTAPAAQPKSAVTKITRPKVGTLTGKVWEIADANPILSRADVIALCISRGIAKGTASTQYSKWRKFNAEND